MSFSIFKDILYNPMPQDQNEAILCFTPITKQISMIIQWVLLALSVVLIGDAIRKFWKMRGSHNSHVTKMYTLILTWWGCKKMMNIVFVAGGVFCIVVYWIAGDYQPADASQLTKYSFVLNWLDAYCIQSILLLVPYHWGKQITTLFSHIERGSEVALEEQNEYKGVQKKIYLTLKVYFIFRIICIALPAIFLISKDPLLDRLFFKLMLSGLLLDCVFITMSLIVGMISLKTTKELRQQIDEDESKRMFNQYLMIIVANTIRFGFDLFYFYSIVINQDMFLPTKCPNFDKIDTGVQLATNIGTDLFAHFLPIFIILRIYNLEEKPEQMCRSLLITTSDG